MTGVVVAPTTVATLVVGAGGLLGGQVASTLRRRGRSPLVASVRWSDVTEARRDLSGALDHLLLEAAGGPWRVLWCAGAGISSTTRDELDAEVGVLEAFLTELAQRASSPTVGPASFFFASSAGGVFAGASEPPFTERTTPCPISPYGEAKLECERVVTRLSSDAPVSALIGRIANLYGPGQNLAKPQGLITHLCRGIATSQPVSVYVSLDTLRDYIYVADCAEMVLDSMLKLESRNEHGGSGVVIKIFASQRSVSVGALLKELARVSRRSPRVLVAASPHAAVQARDLRLQSVVWPEIDHRTLTPLPAGIAATSDDIAQRMRSGNLLNPQV